MGGWDCGSVHHVSTVFAESLEALRAGRGPEVPPWQLDLCESPLEREFYRALWPWLSPDVKLELQAKALTRFGTFRFDFFFIGPARRVVVECDGTTYHDETRDEYRDAITIGYGHADEVIRFHSKQVFGRTLDCVWLLSAWHPWIFSKRGRITLEKLASRAAREGYTHMLHDMVHWMYEDDEDPQGFIAYRRRKEDDRSALWRVYFDEAEDAPHCSFERLTARPEWLLKLMGLQ
jgi:very-short-patch-repair endonuclease